jgi:hypothetical protein
MVSIVVQRPEMFFFVIYFIRSYRSTLETMLKEGKDYPPALLIEVEHMLDEVRIRDEVQSMLINEIEKLSERIDDAQRALKRSEGLFKKGDSVSKVAQEIEKFHPYELNSLKPLSELISLIPESLRMHELTRGTELRANLLWSAQRAILRNYLKLVEALGSS